MKKLIILCLLVYLTGCLTPHAFRERHGKKSGRYSTYKVTEYKDGFKVDMTLHKFEATGVSAEATFDARNKLKKLALWIAEARKRKIRPIEISDVESSHYHNTFTQYTSWRGNIRVYYKKKK